MIETADAKEVIISANSTKMPNTKYKGTLTTNIQNDHKNSELPLSLASS